MDEDMVPKAPACGGETIDSKDEKGLQHEADSASKKSTGPFPGRLKDAGSNAEGSGRPSPIETGKASRKRRLELLREAARAEQQKQKLEVDEIEKVQREAKQPLRPAGPEEGKRADKECQGWMEEEQVEGQAEQAKSTGPHEEMPSTAQKTTSNSQRVGTDKEVKRRVTAQANRRQEIHRQRQEAKAAEKEKEELFAASQRLLRDTRGAAFKPERQVLKPIANVLEKIRQRREELAQQQRKRGCPKAPPPAPSERPNLPDGGAAAAGHRGSNRMESPARSQSHDSASKPEPHQKEAGEAELPLRPPPPSCDGKAAPMDSPSCPREEPLRHESAERPGPSQLQGGNKGPDRENVAEGVGSAPPGRASLAEERCRSSEARIGGTEVPVPSRGVQSARRGDVFARVRHLLDTEAQEEDDEGNVVADASDDEGPEGAMDDAVLERELEKESTQDEARRRALHSRWLGEQDEAAESCLLRKVATGDWRPEGGRGLGVRLLDVDGEESDEDVELDDDDILARLDRKVASVERVEVGPVPDAEGGECAEEDEEGEEEEEEGDDDHEQDLMEAETESEKRRQFLEDSEKQDDFLLPAEDESCHEILGLINRVNGFAAKQPSGSARPTAQRGSGAGVATLRATAFAFVGRLPAAAAASHRSSGCSNSWSSFVFGRNDSNSQQSLSESPDNQEASLPAPGPAISLGRFVSIRSASVTSTSGKGEVSLFGMLRKQSRYVNASPGSVDADSDVSIHDALEFLRPVRGSR